MFTFTYLVAYNLTSLLTLDARLILILRPASSPRLAGDVVFEEGRGGGGGVQLEGVFLLAINFFFSAGCIYFICK